MITAGEGCGNIGKVVHSAFDNSFNSVLSKKGVVSLGTLSKTWLSFLGTGGDAGTLFFIFQKTNLKTIPRYESSLPVQVMVDL